MHATSHYQFCSALLIMLRVLYISLMRLSCAVLPAMIWLPLCMVAMRDWYVHAKCGTGPGMGILMRSIAPCPCNSYGTEVLLALTLCQGSHGQLAQPPGVCCVWRNYLGCGAHEVQTCPDGSIPNFAMSQGRLPATLDHNSCARPFDKRTLTSIGRRSGVLMWLCPEP